MSALGLLQRAFLYGSGRPVALLILLWTTSLCVMSERPAGDSLAELSSSVTGPFTIARQFLFDKYQKYYPREPQWQPVTIVAVDETSLARIGQWPWPRNKLAELVDAIAAYQPAAVGFDMYMPEADQTSPDKVADNLPPGSPPELIEHLKSLPSHETRLAQSLRNTPSVLGAAGFDFTTFTSSAGLRTAPLLVRGGDPLPHVRRFEAVLASLPELQAAAWGQAILSVNLEFGVVRRIPLVSAIGDELVSGLAMEMLRVASGSTAVEVDVSSHGVETVSVADLTVPTQPGGEIWLHYAQSAATAGRYVSAIDVLEGHVDPDQLSGKLVLLGLTGSGLHDMRTTALRELVPGIEIQAQVLETLFEGRFLLRPWWMKWLEIGLILSLGCFLIWFIPRTDSKLASFLKTVPRASMWLTLALNLSVLTMGYLLFRFNGLLFDASSFFLILSGVMGSLISSAMIEFDREAKSLAAHQQMVRETANMVAGKLVKSVEKPADQAMAEKHERVARMTRLLASEVAKHSAFASRLTPDIIELICRAAPLRDVGMEPLAADILHNTETIPQEGLQIIEQHNEVVHIAVAAAQQTLSKEQGKDSELTLQYLHHFRDIVAGQHEWWNGRGYPLGTKQSAIPLSARIVAVIDSYESLMSEQAHRGAMSHKDTVAFIEGASGSQFDPRIIASFGAVSYQFEHH
jgi:adenylate cyclase